MTLGTAAPLLAGLRAAADLSAGIGGPAALRVGRRWATAAARLAAAITARFGRTGFQRTPAAGSGADAAVTFLGPPFSAPDPAVRRAARSAQRALAVPAAGYGPAPAGQGRLASPGPPRPRSSRCSTRPPANTPRRPGCCRGWRHTGPGWARYRNRSTPAVNRPRSPRCPGPTRSRSWPCSPRPGSLPSSRCPPVSPVLRRPGAAEHLPVGLALGVSRRTYPSRDHVLAAALAAVHGLALAVLLRVIQRATTCRIPENERDCLSLNETGQLGPRRGCLAARLARVHQTVV